MTSRADSLRHLEREVGVLIRRIKRVIGERARAVHEDLQPASYLMLSWLVDEGPVRASAMVERFNIDKGAISRQLQHLDELGLVIRTPDPDDGRAQRLVVTEEGRKRLANARGGRRRLMREQLDVWPDADVTAFAALLGRFNTQMDAAVARGDEPT